MSVYHGLSLAVHSYLSIDGTLGQKTTEFLNRYLRVWTTVISLQPPSISFGSQVLVTFFRVYSLLSAAP